MKDITFKKVLLISNTPISPYSAQGASRGSWFSAWDKDRLAHMTFCDSDSSNHFCNYYFTITRAEKRLIRFFKRDSNKPKNSNEENKIMAVSQTQSKKSGIKTTLMLIMQALTMPRYSKRLTAFLNEFKPDIIFCALADSYNARLTMMIANKLNIPYIIQQEDNWLTTEIDDGIIGKAIYRIRENSLKKALAHSSKNYVICPSMKTFYEASFEKEFENLFCADEFSRFIAPEKYDINKKTTFLYIGNSQPGRSAGFVKIAKAIEDTNMINPNFVIYSNNVSKTDVEALASYDFVKIKPHIHHDDVALALSKANVLVLCESFKPDDIEYTRLALSSKIQIYMMAKVPMLIFAPRQTGVMDYALKSKFAYTVTIDDERNLEKAVVEITKNTAVRKELVASAVKVAKQNHDALIIRQNLKQAIYNICEKY
jgi:glycosyltransferase involved in cell wall biosynthesis